MRYQWCGTAAKSPNRTDIRFEEVDTNGRGMALSIRTCIGRVGALAVALGVGSTVAMPSPAALAESADYTALLVCGATCPEFDEPTANLVMDQFVTPIFDQAHPGQTIAHSTVTAPGEAWPLTGILRLLGLAVGDPRMGGLDGPMWPDVPLWKLSGLFDMTVDESIAEGVLDLETAMVEAGNDHLVIYGYSQGSAVVVQEKRRLAALYPWGTDAPDITFVLGGDTNLPNGGFYARFPGLHIPVIEWTFNGPEPTDTQFTTVSINRQYDGFADFPLYPLNVISLANALLGAVYVHGWPFEASLPDDPTTSPAYQGSHGDTSYYFFETEDLPLFAPLRTLGVPESLIDVVEPFFRVIVELGYDRSIDPWVPTPARLFPTTFDPAEVANDLVDAVEEGVDNAAELFSAPVSSSVSPYVASDGAESDDIASDYPASESRDDDPTDADTASSIDTDQPDSPEPAEAHEGMEAGEDEPIESNDETEESEPEISNDTAEDETDPSEESEPRRAEEPNEPSGDDSVDGPQ